MKHFLITRFNVKTRNWDSDKNGNSILDDDWMTHRFQLFENYCFPSVQAQTKRDFRWIVVFNVDTGEQWRQKIKTLQEQCELFFPIFVDGYAHFLPDLKATVASFLTSEDEYIITSRMDNDDLIHQDYVKTVQGKAQNQHRQVIDLRKGYQVNLLNGQVKNYHAKVNPFVSVVEEVSSFETVFAKIHGDWASEPNLVIENTWQMWVQVVHDRNKYVFDKKGLFYDADPRLEEFQMNMVLHNPPGPLIPFINAGFF